MVPLVAIVAALLFAPAAGAAAWRRPVDGPVVRAFAVGPDRFARGQHRGVDLAAPAGAAVRAACTGRVSFAGRVPGGGLTLSVRCGRLVATYQQLASTVLRRGQTVRRGGRLGAAGGSGSPSSRRPHVHLGAREFASGRYVDPLSLFGDAPPALPPVVPRAPAASRLPLRPGPARVPAPAARPLPLAPAPAGAALRHPGRFRARVQRPIPAPSARAPTPGVSPAVWFGLGWVALGLPLGGFIRLRRRRTLARVAQTA